MRNLRIGVAVGIVSLAAAACANAAAGGDSNAGDVWLDNVGQPAGPGHEMDAHLGCTDINLWGAGLADRSGTFAIDGWPPSGTKEQDYTGTWSYGGSGTQVVAVIDAQKLIMQAAANGDRPAAKGYHFKLDFSQDPQKHKTFWVNCPAPSGGPGPAGTAPTDTTPTGTTPTDTTSSGTTPSGTKTPTTGAGGKRRHAVKGVHKRRHRRHHRRHLLKPRRHDSAPVRHVADRRSATALFTG
jgi:hypothetical protein